MDHHLDSIARFNKLQRISIIFTIFSDIKAVDLEVNKEKISKI